MFKEMVDTVAKIAKEGKYQRLNRITDFTGETLTNKKGEDIYKILGGKPKPYSSSKQIVAIYKSVGAQSGGARRTRRRRQRRRSTRRRN
jgi:hypothetical protein